MATSSSKAITEAFLELLKETPANKITVKQLSEAAGVTRSSFYNNYADIPALAQKLCRERAIKVMRAYTGYDSFPDALRDAHELAKKNRRVILNMFNFMDRDVSETFIHRITEEIVKHFYTEALVKGGYAEDEVKAILAVMTDCYFGYVIHWLIGGMRDDVPLTFDNVLPLMDRLVNGKTGGVR